MSKGSKRRPENKQKFNENYDKIFRKTKTKKKPWWVPRGTNDKEHGVLLITTPSYPIYYIQYTIVEEKKAEGFFSSQERSGA